MPGVKATICADSKCSGGRRRFVGHRKIRYMIRPRLSLRHLRHRWSSRHTTTAYTFLRLARIERSASHERAW